MATTVADLLVRVRNLLQDQDGVRWVDDELVRWVNDAQREIVLLKPDSYSTRATHSCVAGTLQSLPSDGLQILDVTRNLDGTKRAIRLVSRYILDAENPTWHSATESSDIRVFTFDERAPTSFYVFPPAQAAAQIEVLYSTAPPAVNIAGSLSLNDIYVGAIVDYVCYRAFSKDAEYAQNGQRAESHYVKFMNSLGVKAQAEKMEGPNEQYNAAYIQRGTR
jgi:hypothetical protein